MRIQLAQGKSVIVALESQEDKNSWMSYFQRVGIQVV